MTDESGNEDIFSYTEKNSKFATLRKISVPVLAIYGEKDEYMKADKKEFWVYWQKRWVRITFRGR